MFVLKTFKKPSFELYNSLIQKINQKYDTSNDGISSLLSALKDRRDYVSVLFDGDNPIGAVSYYISDKSKSIEIDHLGVVDQGNGYGTLLMHKVFLTAIRLNKSVSLMTNGSSNEFYEKVGMYRVNERLPAIYEISIDKLKNYWI